MEKYFLKIIHEEPLDKISLDELKGGTNCTCNNQSGFTCTCNSEIEYVCTCNNDSSYNCSPIDIGDCPINETLDR